MTSPGSVVESLGGAERRKRGVAPSKHSHSDTAAYFASAYSDCSIPNFEMIASLLIAEDTNDVSRETRKGSGPF